MKELHVGNYAWETTGRGKIGAATTLGWRWLACYIRGLQIRFKRTTVGWPQCPGKPWMCSVTPLLQEERTGKQAPLGGRLHSSWLSDFTFYNLLHLWPQQFKYLFAFGSVWDSVGHTSRVFLVELPAWLRLGGMYGWCHRGERAPPPWTHLVYGNERGGKEERTHLKGVDWKLLCIWRWGKIILTKFWTGLFLFLVFSPTSSHLLKHIPAHHVPSSLRFSEMSHFNIPLSLHIASTSSEWLCPEW